MSTKYIAAICLATGIVLGALIDDIGVARAVESEPVDRDSDGVVFVPHGFMLARDFLKLTPEAQDYYTMGLVDGMIAGFAFPGDGKWFFKFLANKDSAQLYAITAKRVKDSPEMWDSGVGMQALNAFLESAGKVQSVTRPDATP